MAGSSAPTASGMADASPAATGRFGAVRSRSGKGLIYVGGLGCGAVVTLAPGTAALAAALLLPALLGCFAEHAPGRPVSRCLLLFGVAGSMPAMVILWGDGGGLAQAVTMALDLHRLAQAWAAQAAAWLLAEFLPLIGRLFADAALAARTRRLRAERARLVEEWSLK